MTKNLSSIIALLIIANLSFAQEVLYCGQTEQTQKLFERYPHLQHQAAQSEIELEEFTQSFMHNKADDDVYIVPMVFHIIHLGGEENISDEQVHDAVNVLNRDFRMLNEDIEDVIEAFQDITSDIEIEFRLAKLDPDGNCTSGINRVYSTLTNAGDEDMKALSQWPRNDYLNIWVCNDAGGAAGYSYLPSSVISPWGANIDGIVLLHNYTGSIGTSSVYRSRTLTHECGHWLNLRHCWGPGNSPGEESNCDLGSDDEVDDTPNSIGWSTCNLNGQSCGDLDNVQNYMEYSYCSRMFSEGQRSRMRLALESSVAQRNQLITSSNLSAAGIGENILCSADFNSESNVVCLGETIAFQDKSLHDVSEWLWDFGDGNTLEGNDPDIHKNPEHFYEEAGQYTITLTVSNGINELDITKENYVIILENGALSQPFDEGFEYAFPANDWFIVNHNDDLTWLVSDAASYSGNNSIVIPNFNNNIVNNTDEFVSSTFDMSEASEIYITYKWAYASKLDLTDDQLRVSVSSDCGVTWSLKEIHRAFIDLNTASATNQSFIPDGNSEWTGASVLIDDQEYLNENFRVKFEFRGKGGNNLFMDNINITSNSPNSISDINFENSAINVYPNPTANSSTISINSLVSNKVEVELVNIVGQTIRKIYQGNLASGKHEFNCSVQGLSDGVYYVRAQVGNEVHMKRLTVIR